MRQSCGVKYTDQSNRKIVKPTSRTKSSLSIFLVLTCLLSCFAVSANDCIQLTGLPSCATQYQLSSNNSHSNSHYIDLVTRNYHLSTTDYSDHSTGLEFTRSYNSKKINSNTGLGRGWQHEYQTRVSQITKNHLQITDRKGRSLHFSLSADDTYNTDNHLDGTIIKNGAILNWQKIDGTLLRFKGPLLTSIKPPGKKPLMLSYKNTRLSSIKSQDGKTISIKYSKSAHMAEQVHIQSVMLPNKDSIEFHYASGLLIRADRNTASQQALNTNEKATVKTAPTKSPTRDASIQQYRQYYYLNKLLSKFGSTKGATTETYNHTVIYNTAGEPVTVQQQGVANKPHKATNISYYSNETSHSARYTLSSGESVELNWNNTQDEASLAWLTVALKACLTCKSTHVTYRYDDAISISNLRSQTPRWTWKASLPAGLAGGLPGGLQSAIRNDLSENIQSIDIMARDSFGRIIEVFTKGSSSGTTTFTYPLEKTPIPTSSPRLSSNSDLYTSEEHRLPISISKGINTVVFAANEKRTIDQSQIPQPQQKNTVTTNVSRLAKQNTSATERTVKIKDEAHSMFNLAALDRHVRRVEQNNCSLLELLHSDMGFENTSENTSNPTDQVSDEHCDTQELPTNTSPTALTNLQGFAIPGAIFVDARTSECTSFFETYQGIRRGTEIEKAMALESRYQQAQSTIHWFPVVDFVVGDTAVSQISRDLTTSSYLRPLGLYRKVMREGLKMYTDFLTPLRENGLVTASVSGATTTVLSEDISTFQFELIIQRGTATAAQIRELHKAAFDLKRLYGIRLQIIEIP